MLNVAGGNTTDNPQPDAMTIFTIFGEKK